MKNFFARGLPLPLGSLVGSMMRQCDSIRSCTTAYSRRPRLFHSSATRPVVKSFNLADIGEGITECQIITWLVKAGDHVEQFDPLCEVQSDKASVEITSRYEGTITALHYETDDMAIVGKPLVDIDTNAEETENDGPPAEPLKKADGDKQLEKAEGLMKDDLQQTANPHIPQMFEQLDEELRSAPAPPAVRSGQTGYKQPVLLTPGVRHMLKKFNLDASQIPGTGRGGRVLKEDIDNYLAKKASPPPLTSPESATGGKGKQEVSTHDTFTSLAPIEYQMFKVMTRSLEIPHFLYTHNVDLTTLGDLRKKVNDSATLSSKSLPKLTPLSFILKALSHAFTQFPKINSHLETESGSGKPLLLIKGSHNFAIAVDTPQGLLVPVVHDVQNHSIISLALEIQRLSELAKSGRLAPKEFAGATFTVSNIGSIGGDAISPIIVAPMVGILGIGRSREVLTRDQHNAEKIVTREQVTLSWSADHRILDGATVARCAQAVGKLLESVDTWSIMLR